MSLGDAITQLILHGIDPHQWIVQHDVGTTQQQKFRDPHARRFAHIVSLRLEGEAEHRNALALERTDVARSADLPRGRPVPRSLSGPNSG